MLPISTGPEPSRLADARPPGPPAGLLGETLRGMRRIVRKVIVISRRRDLHSDGLSPHQTTWCAAGCWCPCRRIPTQSDISACPAPRLYSSSVVFGNSRRLARQAASGFQISPAALAVTAVVGSIADSVTFVYRRFDRVSCAAKKGEKGSGAFLFARSEQAPIPFRFSHQAESCGASVPHRHAVTRCGLPPNFLSRHLRGSYSR